MARGIIDQLRLAARAIGGMRRQPSVMAVVVALALMGTLSSVGTYSIMLLGSDEPTAWPAGDTSFWERSWEAVLGPLPGYFSPLAAAQTGSSGLVAVAGAFAGGLEPLAKWALLLASAAVQALIVAALLKWTFRNHRMPEPTARLRFWLQFYLPVLVICVLSLVAEGVPAEALVAVTLLRCLKQGDHASEPGDLSRFWTRFYLPVLAIYLIPLIPWIPLARWASATNKAAFEHQSSARLFHGLLDRLQWIQFAQYVILRIIGVLLMLAPFVVVGREVGARAGISEGIRLLRRQWASVAALYVVYCVAWQLLDVWPGLLRVPHLLMVTYQAPLNVIASSVNQVFSSLLGLWVAYAFMDIATVDMKRTEPRAPHTPPPLP